MRSATLVILTSWLLCGCPLPAPEEDYCGLEGRQGMTVRKPEGVAEHEHLPTILFHHGFGTNWSGTSVDALRAVDKGYVAISVNTRASANYLGFPPEAAKRGKYARAAREVQCLVRMLRHDAVTDNEYNVDPDRIALAGYSMGGIIGYTAALSSDEARTMAEEIAGEDVLLKKHFADQSGLPNAYIAMSTAFDPIAAATGCGAVSRPFISHFEDGRAVLHDWVHGRDRGRNTPYVCASDLTEEDLAEIPVRMKRHASLSEGIQLGFDDRLAEYGSDEECSEQCEPSCAEMGGECAPVDEGCSCLTSQLLWSEAGADRTEILPGVVDEEGQPAMFLQETSRDTWERWSPMTYVASATRIPVLILHGDDDARVHASGASLAYDLLAHHGFPVKMVTYAGIGHTWGANGESRSSPERVMRDEELFTFLDRDLQWQRASITEPCLAPAAVSSDEVVASAQAVLDQEELTEEQQEFVQTELTSLAAAPPAQSPRHCEASGL